MNVIFEGKEYRLTQDAYVSDDGATYQASAQDADNNEYMVVWEVNHPDFENLTDESEACDWENPIRVTRI